MHLYYKEYKPGEALKPYVVSYWSMTSDGSINDLSPRQRCFPAGTIEWITQVRGRNMIGLYNNQWRPYPASIFTGICDRATEWATYGDAELVGVRLTPEGALRLFGPPLKEYFNNILDAEALLGSSVSSVLSNIRSAEAAADRLFIIESFLHKQIKYKSLDETYFTRALQLIRHTDELNIADISKKVYVGERQLQRSFQNTLGISPKAYQRVMRLYKAHQMGLMRVDNYTNIAYKMGYADPAHFNRDFKKYFGVTPELHFASTNMKYMA